MEKIELGIIGGGIAGISCALYAKRSGITPVIFEKSSLGGQLMFIDRIDNYPGLKLGTKGSELLKALTAAVNGLGIEVKEEAGKISLEDNRIVVSIQGNSYFLSSLVIASGASFGKLGIEGEKDFSGRGVSWCAVCDGYFFKNKEVVVIGGGNTAAEEAIYLSSICKKVYLIHRRDKLRALDYLQKEILEKDNLEVFYNTTVKQIKGKEFVEEIVLGNVVDKKESAFSVSGVFIATGIKPNTDIVKDIIDIDDGGFIITDAAMKTSVDSIYSCGDCRKRQLRQLITAASEGAIAALSAYRYLKGGYISS